MSSSFLRLSRKSPRPFQRGAGLRLGLLQCGGELLQGLDQVLEFLRGSVGWELEGAGDDAELFLGSLDAGGGRVGKLCHCLGEVSDCLSIALVKEFDVLRELVEVFGEGVDDVLSLRRGGHGEWVAPVEPVGLTRRVWRWDGGRGTGGWVFEARGLASRSLGVGSRGGRGAGWVERAGSQA